MRTHGTLIKWNDERGFGFILHGTQEIFVHVSAFPRDGNRPVLNELVSFEAEPGPNGKLRAVRVMRPDRPKRKDAVAPSRARRQTHRTGGAGLVVLLVVLLGAFAYSRFQPSATQLPRLAPEQRISPLKAPAANPFRCDGRTMCSQMRSCAEARFFLANCPNTKMDGNHDGDPCEQQWCN
jgi:cold shock CspA family protein